MRIKSSIYSLSAGLDNDAHYVRISDTARITDINDPDKTAGYVIDQLYVDMNGILKKAILYDYDTGHRTYYFSDSGLVKVVIRDLNNIVLKTFYYSMDDNAISSYAITRIISVYPERRDYYDNLKIGRSYLLQNRETNMKR
jgi:hypothetical protein